MTDVRLVVTNPEDSSIVPAACNAKGELKLEEPIKFDGNLDGDLTVSGDITSDGAATIGGSVQAGGQAQNGQATGVSIGSFGAVNACRSSGSSSVFLAYIAEDSEPKISIRAEGTILSKASATFAGNKAGFTKEGYLWCTTRRGDTVILDATSNGLATWANYEPPTRLIRDESNTISQDLPETPTGTP